MSLGRFLERVLRQAQCDEVKSALRQAQCKEVLD